MCSLLGIPKIYVYDRDVFMRDGKLNMKALKSYVNEPDIERVEELQKEPSLETFREKFNAILEQYGIFLWDVGKIEDVIGLSCDTKSLQDQKKCSKAWKLSHVDNDTVEKISEELIEKQNIEIVRFLCFVERAGLTFVKEHPA